MKECTKCHRILSTTEFYTDKNTKDSLTYTCKTCRRQYSKQYYHSDAGRAQRAMYRKSGREAKAQAKYRRTDKSRERWRRYYRSAKRKATRRKYEESTRGKAVRRSIEQRYRAKRKGLAKDDNPITADIWEAIKVRHGSCCIYCGKKSQRLTMDHIIPLARGGLHIPENIVPACHSCNSQKHTKPMLAWLMGGIRRVSVMLKQQSFL